MLPTRAPGAISEFAQEGEEAGRFRFNDQLTTQAARHREP
jgi:hypothetical protein